METIESLQNARIKQWAALHQAKERSRTGLFLVEGDHLIGEAIKAGAVSVVVTDREPLFGFEPTIHVTEAIMSKLSANPSGAHWIAVCRILSLPVRRLDRVLMLDGIQDPGNLGTLIRTAVSFSFDAVYCSLQTCDLYNEKAVRSTQGALFAIPVIRGSLAEKIAELKEQDVMVVATTLAKARSMKEIPPVRKMAFILGNEGQGITPEILAMADDRLRIEMKGFESLNVAVAGGIIMYNYRGEEQ